MKREELGWSQNMSRDTTYTSKGQLGEKVDQPFSPARTGSKIGAKEGEPLVKKEAFRV